MRSKIPKVDFFEIVGCSIGFLIIVLLRAMLEIISFFHFIVSPKFRNEHIGHLRGREREACRLEANELISFDECARINRKVNFYEKIDKFLTKKTP